MPEDNSPLWIVMGLVDQRVSLFGPFPTIGVAREMALRIRDTFGGTAMVYGLSAAVANGGAGDWNREVQGTNSAIWGIAGPLPAPRRKAAAAAEGLQDDAGAENGAPGAPVITDAG